VADVKALVESLLTLDDDVLEAQLGARAQAIEDDVAGRGARGAGADPASLDSIDVEEIRGVAARAATDSKLLAAGQRLFSWINPAAYKLLCTPLGGEGADETMQQLVKLLDEDLERNVAKAAGMLTPFLTANLGLAPAIAALVSTLIIKRVSHGFAEFTCDTWQKALPSSDITETPSATEASAGT
jgi:hypothetical protein